MTDVREIYCVGCEVKVTARLIDGQEAYPHRQDLYALPFWKCDTCGNFVGCHWKTKNRTQPLGCIPTPELKAARQHIHKILDPIWKNGGANGPLPTKNHDLTCEAHGMVFPCEYCELLKGKLSDKIND